MLKTSSAKAKGRKHQQNIRDAIMRAFPHLQEGDIESRSMGSGGVDLMFSPLARKTLPISIEAKKTKKTPARAEIGQAQANAYEGTIGAVVWSPHGTGPGKELIMFDFNEFLDWYKRYANESDLPSLQE